MKNIISILGEKRKIIMAIIVLALPAILEMSFNTFLGLADTLMISRFIGADALAAVGFANQINFSLIFVFSSFNTGATSMIARSYGEKDYKKLNKIAGQAVTINFLIGMVISILAAIFAKNILSIYEVSDIVREYMMTYYIIIVVGMVSMFLNFSFAAILRGSGDTITPLVITALVNILNIAGNYVLITGYGPFPEMGVAGAAWSTVISRTIAMLAYAYVLFMRKKKVHIKIKNLGLSKKIVKPLWKISYPGAIEQGLMQLAFIVLGVIIAKLDTDSEATFRILINLESTSFMPAVGLSIAAATLVGKALGEKDKDKASETGYVSAFLGISWGLVMGVIFFLLSSQLVAIFTPEENIIAIGASVMFALAINQPFLNFMIVMSGALRGAGDTRNVMIITVLRLWLVFVPGAYLFISRWGQGLVGIWYAEILSFVLFSAVIFMRFYRKKWVDIRLGEEI